MDDGEPDDTESARQMIAGMQGKARKGRRKGAEAQVVGREGDVRKEILVQNFGATTLGHPLRPSEDFMRIIRLPVGPAGRKPDRRPDIRYPVHKARKNSPVLQMAAPDVSEPLSDNNGFERRATVPPFPCRVLRP